MADRSIVLRCSNCGSPQYEWSAGRPAGAIPDFGKLQTHPCHVCGEAVNWALFANDKYHALLAEDCIGLMTAEQNLNLLLIRAVAEGVDPGPVPICPSAIWTAALNLEIERAVGAHKPRIVVPVVVAGRPVGAPVRRGVSHKHVIVVPVVVAPGWSKALQRLPGALAAAVLVLSIVSRMDWSESQRPRPATTKSSNGIPVGEPLPANGGHELQVAGSAPAQFGSTDTSWISIEVGETARGFQLRPDGSLGHEGSPVTGPIPASYLNDEMVVARRIIWSPASPNRRFAFFMACDAIDDTALCGNLYLMDLRKRVIKNPYAGKYGPDESVEWSRDGEHALLRYHSHGESHVYRIYLRTAESVRVE